MDLWDAAAKTPVYTGTGRLDNQCARHITRGHHPALCALVPKHLYFMNYKNTGKGQRWGGTWPPSLLASQSRWRPSEAEDLVPSAIVWVAMKVGDQGLSEGDSALRIWAVG